MEKLTKGQAIELHRQMWNWIADKTERVGVFFNDDEYFEAMGIPDKNYPRAYCYCCEYAVQQNGGEFRGRCKYCPLNWESECNVLMCCDKKETFDEEGLFARWNYAGDIDNPNIKERVRVAREIANLKQRL